MLAMILILIATDLVLNLQSFELMSLLIIYHPLTGI